MNKIFFIALLFLSSLVHAQEQELNMINESLASWDVLKNNIAIPTLNDQSTSTEKHYIGEASAFGQTVSIEYIRPQNSKSFQLIVHFPEAASLSTDQIISLAGSNVKSVLPAGMGANVEMKRLELSFLNNRISEAAIVFGLSTFVPSQGTEFTLQNIELNTAILNPLGSPKGVSISLSSELKLPQEINEYLGIGETVMSVKGSINAVSSEFSLTALIDSDRIPIGNQDVLFLKNAFIELHGNKSDIGIALGGGIELIPPQDQSLLLNGELAISKTSLFGQGWLGNEWHNPMDISTNLYLTDLGFGFGVDFGKPPFPLPIMAFTGGLSVRDLQTNAERFSGSVTVGIHTGDPSQNMIDAKNINANLYDIVQSFYPPGVPQEMKSTLQAMFMQNARLTIVPPGEGIELFGKEYDPGIHVQGKMKIEGHSGEMLVHISEQTVEAYGKLTQIQADGFSLTSADGKSGPELIFILDRNKISNGVLIVDGKINVMDISKAAKIFVSDKGFEIQLHDKILNRYESKIDLAGTNLFKGGSVYVKAAMKNDLMSQINEIAADEIEKTAQKVNKDLDNAKRGLELNRPLLVAAENEYKRVKNQVQKEYEASCNKLNNLKQQEADQKNKKADLNKKIAAVEAKIASLKTSINNAYKPANFLYKTSCGSGTFFDPINGGTCWTCPSGYNRTVFAVTKHNACERPAYEAFSKATDRGPGTGFLGVDCPSGAFRDPNGRCYSCPSGYNRTLHPVTGNKACSKLISADFKPATQIKSVACPSPKILDPRSGGECWECPTGYNRTVFPVHEGKACEIRNLAELNIELAGKASELLALIAERDIIVGALGDLTIAMTQELIKSCEIAASSELVNADPRVAPKLAKMAELKTIVDGFQLIVDNIQKMSVGTLNAAAWVVKNGGNAAGIVNVKQAEFKGCLDLCKGGSVALRVKGTYADNPIDVSFDVNLKSPESAIRVFADQLLATNTAKATKKNGSCQRPNVPKPNIEGSLIAQFKESLISSNPVPTSEPNLPKCPDYALVKRFEEGDFQTQFSKALEKFDSDRLIELSAHGIDLNVKSSKGYSPLMVVSHAKGLFGMKQLINKGSDINHAGGIALKDGLVIGNLLANAVYRKDQDMLDYLVAAKGLSPDMVSYNPETKSPTAWSAVEMAAYLGNETALTYLIDNGASHDKSQLAGLLSTKNKQSKTFEILLANGFKFSKSDEKGMTALHYAAKNNMLSELNTLISKKVSIDGVSKQGQTPLLLAAFYGYEDICKALVLSGADINKEFQGKTAAKWAKKNGFKELAKSIKKKFQ